MNTAVNVWSNCTIADDRSQILTWLSPLEPRLRHQDIRDRRVETVGEWLLQTEEFRSWYAGSGGDESDNVIYGVTDQYQVPAHLWQLVKNDIYI